MLRRDFRRLSSPKDFCQVITNNEMNTFLLTQGSGVSGKSLPSFSTANSVCFLADRKRQKLCY